MNTFHSFTHDQEAELVDNEASEASLLACIKRYNARIQLWHVRVQHIAVLVTNASATYWESETSS